MTIFFDNWSLSTISSYSAILKYKRCFRSYQEYISYDNGDLVSTVLDLALLLSMFVHYIGKINFRLRFVLLSFCFNYFFSNLHSWFRFENLLWLHFTTVSYSTIFDFYVKYLSVSVYSSQHKTNLKRFHLSYKPHFCNFYLTILELLSSFYN